MFIDYCKCVLLLSPTPNACVLTGSPRHYLSSIFLPMPSTVATRQVSPLARSVSQLSRHSSAVFCCAIFLIIMLHQELSVCKISCLQSCLYSMLSIYNPIFLLLSAVYTKVKIPTLC